jgi:hypothetical protein
MASISDEDAAGAEAVGPDVIDAFDPPDFASFSSPF